MIRTSRTITLTYPPIVIAVFGVYSAVSTGNDRISALLLGAALLVFGTVPVAAQWWSAAHNLGKLDDQER